MERMSTPPLLLAPVRVGAVVGSWRVEAWAGYGAHGAVYRAVLMNAEHARPVALKVALYPRDPRFTRELELYSRGPHPNVPRLLDHGEWQSPHGTRHPFLVIEWVDGVPLYEQAQQHPPSARQVMQWLAQLARALESVHARGCIHRDVKGGNVLVQRADRRAFLTDFGSGIYPVAAPLTPSTEYPGTPAYRAPESWLFDLQPSRNPAVHPSAGPAGDLYALGATAHRLLTGEYPEFAAPTQDENGTWHLDAVIPPPALLRVEPSLRALVLRMLSVRPEERGTAAQLAEALEHATEHIAEEGAAAQQLLPQQPAPARDSAAPVGTQGLPRSSPAGCAMAAAALALAIWAWWAPPSLHGKESPAAHAAHAQADSPDAGTSGLGEALAAASTEPSPELRAVEVMAEETPPEPQPGQARPDAKGRCPRKRQIALNGGCWVEHPFNQEECEEKGGYIFKKTCYLPIASSGRPPTSSPTDKP